MSAFTDAEVTYLKSQRLGRLATVGADGHPLCCRWVSVTTLTKMLSKSVDMGAFRNEEVS
jgi:hypothetical protein